MSHIASSTTNSTSRTQSWKSLSVDVATLVQLRPASHRNRFRSASAPPQFVAPVGRFTITANTPRCPKKSALKRPTSAAYSWDSSPSDSTDSSPSSSPVPPAPSGPVQVDLWAACLPLTSDAKNNEPLSSPLPRTKSSLLNRVRRIQIFTPSPPRRHRRVSREFPNLPPPPEWDEVSLTIESDSDDDQLSSPITRKVRFVVPAPPPPPPSPEPSPALSSRCWDEEPTWSEFMENNVPSCPFQLFAHAWLGGRRDQITWKNFLLLNRRSTTTSLHTARMCSQLNILLVPISSHSNYHRRHATSEIGLVLVISKHRLVQPVPSGVRR
ncbi:hypothetical protein C8F04DRAFT_1234349 [Mycena alexandri]|uniref:Uncharacterized protein n=1 Tax=Mycena alexandri TaxID=1745969 RepID=A0AAD6SWD7_9AGAR|nr:hypothetical protein C8F04DRAFT_1234349 [Mycena alexandri]